LSPNGFFQAQNVVGQDSALDPAVGANDAPPNREPHRRSGLANLPSVGAIP